MNPANCSEIVVDLMYTSRLAQVRLFFLPPGQEIEVWSPEAKTADSLDTTASGQDWFVIRGDVKLTVDRCVSRNVTMGDHCKIQSGQRILFLNAHPEPVELLQIDWQPSKERQVQKEVTEERPWGSFTVLGDEPSYKLKQLYVKPEARLSLQRHQKREEHWVVTDGVPEITIDHQQYSGQVGEYYNIPLHAWHRLANPATEGGVEIIELQLGEYFGEDDIERASDDYGRV